MKRRFTTLLPILFCLPAMPALAQTAIGGGVCNSSTLNGTYELLLSGRQVSASGAVSKVFQAVGTAAFDGYSKVTFTMTANSVGTSQSFGTPLVYSGTYSLQSNCVGSISITTGDTATFGLEALSVSNTTQLASSFSLTGSDATYAYNGSGNSQPATCPTTLSGVHEFNATGSSLSGALVVGRAGCGRRDAIRRTGQRDRQLDPGGEPDRQRRHGHGDLFGGLHVPGVGHAHRHGQ